MLPRGCESEDHATCREVLRIRDRRGFRNLNRNMERVRNLKRNTAFIDDENGLPYRHPIIQQAINSIWFRDRRSEGAMFSEHIYPMSYEAIALVLAVVRSFPIYMTRSNAELIVMPFFHKIECCFDEWRGGIRTEIPMGSTLPPLRHSPLRVSPHGTVIL
jgi:Domain of unknown function (DUF6532)